MYNDNNGKELLLKCIHKLYRKDPWLNSVFDAIGIVADGFTEELKSFVDNLFIDSATETGIEFYEKMLAISPLANRTLPDRRSVVIAKLRSDGNVTLKMLQSVADSWKNGETELMFENGCIIIRFVGEYGVPSDLVGLKSALDEIKPAHLALNYIFKYLLIKDIHEVMSLNETETAVLGNFAGGN